MEQNNNLGQKRPFPLFGVLLIAILLVIVIISIVPKGTSKEIAESDFRAAFENHQVAGIYIYGTSVRGVYTEDVGIEKHKVSLEDFIKSKGSKNDFYYSIITGAEIVELKNKIIEYNKDPLNVDRKIWYDGEPVQESWISKIWPFVYIILLVLFFWLIFKKFIINKIYTTSNWRVYFITCFIFKITTNLNC